MGTPVGPKYILHNYIRNIATWNPWGKQVYRGLERDLGKA